MNWICILDLCLGNLSNKACKCTYVYNFLVDEFEFNTNAYTIDTEIKAKRNNMISDVITFRITKRKRK